ncbi:xylulokinase [Microlunatus sagamiharensis]|uniref:Xylulokinase n=1 Tax=Microlunatus sagamiharensis TaxID=546874 RepID=A0A1H2MKV1_9ACTN|nr:FGGY family carbohydrate kinase [Microlunatus sagamiharensis]SDU93863.1 xylulokinase [Microlunatus sagamiharensis]
MHALSIDFGTSSVKVAVVQAADDGGLQIVETATAPYPNILLPGEKNEIDPDELWAGCYAACQQLDPALRERVEVLCYDTFSPSPVFVRRDGTLSYPNIVTHLDRRSRAQSAYIDAVVGNERFLEIAGILPFAGGAGAMTFIWFAQNAPEVLDDAHRIGHLPTYVHHRLTGEWATDLVNASMTGLYETTTQGTWSEELLTAFGIDRGLLCDIVDPGTSLGTLRPEEAERLGLRAGIPVAVGTNDMAAAQCGAGNVEAGRVMNTAGSSDMVSVLTDRPVTSHGYYLRNAALPGLWQIYATTAGGFALEWFWAQLCQDMTRTEFYEQFVGRALEAWPTDGEVTFAPYLTGDRQSLEKRTGSWDGLTLATTREEMLAAVLKSMNRVLAATLRQAAEVVELDPVVKLTGGMSDATYVALKQREMPGFEFEGVDNCPILGNVWLARRGLGLV